MRILNRKYVDDDKMSLARLFWLRTPTLVIGLFLGLVLSAVTSRFEEVLSRDVRIAYFVPLVVYMASAIGTQTQSIYTRDLLTGKASFKGYLLKETFLGVLLGLVFGLISGVVVFVWMRSLDLSWALALGMFGAVSSAPFASMIVTEIFELEHSDPAVGAGPIATVIQDTLSVIIFGLAASAVFL